MSLSLRLFTLTALATLAAVLVLFAVQQHSFREGLLERANRQAAERASSLLPLLIREHRDAGGWERLRGNPRLFRRLNDQSQGLPPGPPPGRRRDGLGMGPGPGPGPGPEDPTLAGARPVRHPIPLRKRLHGASRFTMPTGWRSSDRHGLQPVSSSFPSSMANAASQP
jgi:hypothetical protein